MRRRLPGRRAAAELRPRHGVSRRAPRRTRATTDLVNQLRDDVIPATGVDAKVGGLTAGSVDFASYLGERMPLLIGVVLLLSFLLLMAVFRSMLVPLKAVLMNLLSVGAAYGILVAIFQWGWGMGLIGVDKAGPIEAWVPMFLFAIVFGLSMDYEVFLLSRIKEEYDRTKDNATAVADGLAATARVITAAAIIMFCVFAAFALGDDRQLKLFGLGLAIAVLVDATLVRMVLVPATMELLGDTQLVDPEVARPDPAEDLRRGPAPHRSGDRVGAGGRGRRGPAQGARARLAGSRRRAPAEQFGRSAAMMPLTRDPSIP